MRPLVPLLVAIFVGASGSGGLPALWTSGSMAGALGRALLLSRGVDSRLEACLGPPLALVRVSYQIRALASLAGGCLRGWLHVPTSQGPGGGEASRRGQ